MFHFISSYDLVETEVYHQKFSFTRKWEDCGGLSDCEELVCVQIEFIHPFFGYLCYRDTMFA